MLKLAIISDIHANLPALAAVLEDIKQSGADQVYCLGDLTDAAPWHNEVIALIREKQIPVIMGNHDERIAFDHPVKALSKHSKEEQAARLIAINFTKETITPEHRAFLAELPHSIQLQFAGFRLLLVHGSTRSNDEYIYADHDEDDLLGMLEEQRADILITGHTHLSYIRPLKAAGKMVINTGSVGRTKEKDRLAAYLQLSIVNGEITPQIRKVSYPLEETIAGIRNSAVPDFYADFLAGHEKV
ncbi:metallophosphoesterase family protein [Chitinophaga arvensicola]|uniref:Phosphoesterase, MJ0936 family n=1 Tax=Chitinophaga arvensicola TaxID=29529 RepID=A0A1I0REH4_9BACT|nr:metallophosphoesterase family protein [Chitinophaga arvensicola]SEW39156.1 phosphoesterase, MJ0936 family [Chitinophaga arvensicola]